MNSTSRKNWREELYQLFEANSDMKEPEYSGIFIEKYGTDYAPSKSAIQKELVKLRKAKKLMSLNPGVNRTWHVGTLNEYPISPATVAKIFDWIVKGTKVKPDLHLPTVRVALWMDRLSALPLSITKLHRLSMYYSLIEKANELYGFKYNVLGSLPDEYIINKLSDDNGRKKLLEEDFSPGFDTVTVEQLNNVLSFVNKSVAEAIEFFEKDGTL
jgi:hypothetical protein